MLHKKPSQFLGKAQFWPPYVIIIQARIRCLMVLIHLWF